MRRWSRFTGDSDESPTGRFHPEVPGPRFWFSQPGPWTTKKRLFFLAGLLAAFLAFYLLMAPSSGGSAGSPAGLVVLAVGYLLGPAAGLIAGLLMMPLLWSTYPLVGLSLDETGLPSMMAFVALMAVMGLAGGVVGSMHQRAEAARVEATLLASELERAQTLARIGYWSLWSDGRLQWSRSLWKAFGFTSEPSDVEAAFDRIHPDDEAFVRADVEATWKDGRHAEGEHRVVLPDGSLRWIAYTCDAERDDEGIVVRVFGTGQDITERKSHEATQTQLKHLLDHLDDVYWVGDPANDEFEYSHAAERLFGYSVEELSVDPSKMAEKVHAGDLEGVMAAIGQVVAGQPATSEFRIIRPDGSVRHVLSRAWPIQDDSMFTAHGIMRDVTAEKELEEAHAARLRQGEDFRRLLDNLDDIYFTDDLQGHLRVSAAVQEMYGRSPQEFRDDPDLWQKLVLDEDKGIAEQAFRDVMQGKQVETTMRIHHTDGSVRTVRATVWPRMEDDQVVGAIGVIHDITAEEEVVRLKELDEMKALFMSAAAHELNTPLTPLKLQTAVLEKESPGDRKVEIIKRNVERMEHLVKDLLDASRLQAHRLKHDIQDDMDLSKLLMDVAVGASLQAKEDGKTWQAKVDPDLRLRGDPHRLMQVFTNITNNAIKFTPEGGQVTLTAEQKDDALHVAVQDTGLGLEPDEIDGLFVPFRQFHRGKTGVHKGTGLGLFISHGIVEHHEGRIDVESEGEGKGSTFTVILPVKNTATSVDSESSGEESG